MFYVFCTLLFVHSSIAIILMGKRELVALLNLSSWCLVMVERLFLLVPGGCLQFVIVVFPDHTHLLNFIPSKMTKTKYSVPWIHATIKRLVKKRHKLYLRAPKSKDPDVKIHYKRFRAHVQKVLRDAYWKHVSNIFTFENDSSVPDTPKPEKIKKFCKI